MSGEFRILAERCLVYMKYSGETSSEECRDIQMQIVSSPEWHPEFGVLVDYSAVTSYQGDFTTMQRFCSQMQDSGKFDDSRTPVIYYAPSDLGFGIARMAQQVLSAQLPFEIEVFREQGGALAALGQPETLLSELLATPS